MRHGCTRADHAPSNLRSVVWKAININIPQCVDEAWRLSWLLESSQVWLAGAPSTRPGVSRHPSKPSTYRSNRQSISVLQTHRKHPTIQIHMLNSKKTSLSRQPDSSASFLRTPWHSDISKKTLPRQSSLVGVYCVDMSAILSNNGPPLALIRPLSSPHILATNLIPS